ncbi:MAG: sulfatase [Coraliomargaritaceae bacterium]
MKLLCLLIIPLFVCHFVSAQLSSRPNILFIMSDDHAAPAVGVYGSHLAKLNPTPCIDRLAAEGVLFENAFCHNSICTPSRASILTGQYSQTNGVLDLDDALEVSQQYLPIEMKRLGYSTAMIGKWHLKNEPGQFDYYKVLPSQGLYFDPDFREKGQGTWPNNIVQSKGHSSDIITDSTIDYLRTLDLSKPFFIMHHYKAPHDDFEYAPRYSDYLANVTIPEPDTLFNHDGFGSVATRGENDSLRTVIGSSVSNRHEVRNYVKNYVRNASLSPVESTRLSYQTYLKDYLRCVKGIDDNLERLFDELKTKGLWENTIIVYTSDQGFMLGAHDLIDKRWMYEESMQIPLVIRFPQQGLSGIRSDLLVNNTDFAPTLIELAGGSAPEYMQGRSFVKTLQGIPESDWRTATYYRYWMHMIHHWVPAHFGIRTKNHKLIFYYGRNYRPEEAFKNFYWGLPESEYDGYLGPTPTAWEFYDLKNDPEEKTNQYANPEYQTVIRELKKSLFEQREALDETDQKYPEIEKIIQANR